MCTINSLSIKAPTPQLDTLAPIHNHPLIYTHIPLALHAYCGPSKKQRSEPKDARQGTQNKWGLHLFWVGIYNKRSMCCSHLYSTSHCHLQVKFPIPQLRQVTAILKGFCGARWRKKNYISNTSTVNRARLVKWNNLLQWQKFILRWINIRHKNIKYEDGISWSLRLLRYSVFVENAARKT